MTYFTHIETRSSRTWVMAICHFANRWVRSVTAWQDRRMCRKALRQIPEKYLHDIGMTKADIESNSPDLFRRLGEQSPKL